MQAAAAAAASGVRSPERMPSGPARGWEDADSALESGGGRARSAAGPGRGAGERRACAGRWWPRGGGQWGWDVGGAAWDGARAGGRWLTIFRGPFQIR